MNTAAAHRDTIVMVRWALIITCAYLVLFSENSRGAAGLAPLVIVAFLASNLVIGRLPARSITWPGFHISVATMDTVLIGVSLYCAGQLSPELVVLLLGVLVLAIAGIRLGVIAVLTVGLAAAVAYAWLAEIGRHEPGAEARASEVVSDLAHDLSLQFETIERCQAAASQGLVSATQGLLAEIAQANLQMRARATGAPLREAEAHHAPAVAHSAA